jgi:hypothetical protein
VAHLRIAYYNMPMPAFDIDRADSNALAREYQACKDRMEHLKAEYQRERQLLEQIEKRLYALVCGLVIDEKDARKIESDMLKAASRIITLRHKAKLDRKYAKSDAMMHAEDIAKKHGYRAVPPRVEAKIDEKLAEVYGGDER